MHNQSSNLNETLADAVMNRPREFFINRKRFCLWYPCLGASLMIQRHLIALNIDDELLNHNPYLEALRLCSVKREEVCMIVAISSFNTFKELSNSRTLERRANFFSHSLSNEELAELFMLIITAPRVETLIKETGLDKEQDKQRKISEVKNKEGNMITFGGKTIYGSLIVPACDKLRMTPHQVVWEISLLNLRMLMADSINSVYLTDEEMKKSGVYNTSQLLNAGDAKNMAFIKAQDWT